MKNKEKEAKWVLGFCYIFIFCPLLIYIGVLDTKILHLGWWNICLVIPLFFLTLLFACILDDR